MTSGLQGFFSGFSGTEALQVRYKGVTMVMVVVPRGKFESPPPSPLPHNPLSFVLDSLGNVRQLASF
jgi:hypothetical protein